MHNNNIDEETGYILNDTYGEEFADKFVKDTFFKVVSWGVLVVLIAVIISLIWLKI